MRLLRKEQTRRDATVKGWIPLIHRATEQWNLLMEKISQTLINTTGKQIDVKAVCGEMKRDFSALMSNQQAGGSQVAKGAALQAGMKAGKAALQSFKPKIAIRTDHSLLWEGKSPIAEIDIEFRHTHS